MQYEVGQEVVLRGGNKRRNIEPPIGRVLKVGRKLVTVEDQWGWPRQYRMEDGRANDRYGHAWIQTREQYAEEMARSALLDALLKRGVTVRGYSNNALNAILAILDNDDNNEEV